VIDENTIVYHRYVENPEDAMWLHLGAVFLEVCQERPFCGCLISLRCLESPFCNSWAHLGASFL